MKTKIRMALEFKRHLSPVRFKALELRNVVDAADHEGISRSLQFMAQNFTRPIQIKDIVTISGMSCRGFTKAFNQHVGCTPGVFMQQTRIKYAKQLLTEHDLNLKQVARLCGYRSENTFCVAFQRATNTSPKKFQRQYLLAIFHRHRKAGDYLEVLNLVNHRLQKHRRLV